MRAGERWKNGEMLRRAEEGYEKSKEMLVKEGAELEKEEEGVENDRRRMEKSKRRLG
jgi:hypothetical protein